MPDTDQECVYVVCGSDEKYVMPLAAMLRSLVEHLKKYKKIIVFVLETDIKPASKKKLLRSVEKNGVEIDVRFMPLDRSSLEGVKVDGHISLATYYRLLIGSVLPPNIDKVIYLDSDLIINEDIGNLWDVPIGKNCILAAQEQWEEALTVSSPKALSNYKELGLAPDRKYFNAGVMSINLDEWRKNDIGAAAIQYMDQNMRHIRWWDQDALNAILSQRWGELDPRWNLLSHMFTNSRWNSGPIKNKEDYDQLMRQPYIIHFSGHLKPWGENCSHPRAHLFFHYLDRTKWKGWRLKNFFMKMFR